MDTHPLLWSLAGESRRLSRRAAGAFRDAEELGTLLHVPAVVLLEAALLEQLGRVRMEYRKLREQLEIRPGFRIEPFTAEDVDEARALAGIRDPFDRMIAATAIRLGLPLLTRDETLSSVRGLRTVW